MTRRCPHRRRRAFTMIEIMMGIIIVGLVLTIAAQLFQTVIRAGRGAADSRDAASSFDAAVATLRADVWGARELAVAQSELSLRLTTSDGSQVAWSIVDQTIQRAQGATNAATMPAMRPTTLPSRTWSVPAELRFVQMRSGLTLQVRADKDSPPGDIQLVNQLRLLEDAGK